MTSDDVMPTRSEATKRAIVDTALELFRERGYEKTTMRAIAEGAGVSVGNAYYYFASKEHLVQSFYDRIQYEHARQVAPALERSRDFRTRLAAAEIAWLEVARPYHEFSSKFLRNAVEPSSPLSPFSPQSKGARDASIAIFRDVVAGSDIHVSSRLRPRLPELLWLYHLGIVLHWVHDQSAGQERTSLLVSHTTRLIDRLLPMTRLLLLRGATDDVVAMLDDVRPPGNEVFAPHNWTSPSK